MLSDFIKNKVEVLCITESKLEQSLPTSVFLINGFSAPYRRDRTGNGGGILVYIRNDIPSKEITFATGFDKEEHIFVEISLFKTKWLIGNIYNPHKNNISTYLREMAKTLDHFYLEYENILLQGDFNSVITDRAFKEFSDSYNLKLSELIFYRLSPNKQVKKIS